LVKCKKYQNIVNIRIKHSETEWVLFLILNMGLAFSGYSPAFQSFALPIFLFFFICIYGFSIFR